MNTRKQLLVGVLLGAALLVFVSRGLEWPAVVAALRRASGLYLLLALASVLAYVIAKALRWRFLVCPFTTATTWQLLPAIFVGIAGNTLVPHAGELVRAVVARRYVAVGISTLMGTIFVERMLDFVALTLIAVGVLIPLGAMTERLRIATWIVASLGGVILVAGVFLTFRTAHCLAWVERALSRLTPTVRERIMHEAHLGAEGLASLRQPRLLMVVLALSIGQWLLVAAAVYFSLRVVGIGAGAVAVASVLLLSVVGVTFPTAPGYVGTLQAAFALGLAPFGVDPVNAVAASLVYNLLMVVPIWLAALPYLPGLTRRGAS